MTRILHVPAARSNCFFYFGPFYVGTIFLQAGEVAMPESDDAVAPAGEATAAGAAEEGNAAQGEALLLFTYV